MWQAIGIVILIVGSIIVAYKEIKSYDITKEKIRKMIGGIG
ncbi:MAG: hypothetical protein SFH39_00250 [Candidatus Magnetobacterium sp. LHC-1]